MHIGWQPDQFWRATFHEFTTAIWAKRAAHQPQKQELTRERIMATFGAMAKRRA